MDQGSGQEKPKEYKLVNTLIQFWDFWLVVQEEKIQKILRKKKGLDGWLAIDNKRLLLKFALSF